jgi:hypothetical protein
MTFSAAQKNEVLCSETATRTGIGNAAIAVVKRSALAMLLLLAASCGGTPTGIKDGMLFGHWQRVTTSLSADSSRSFISHHSGYGATDGPVFIADARFEARVLWRHPALALGDPAPPPAGRTARLGRTSGLAQRKGPGLNRGFGDRATTIHGVARRLPPRSRAAVRAGPRITLIDNGCDTERSATIRCRSG